MVTSTAPDFPPERRLEPRQRWMSFAEFVVGGSVVILHNVYHRVPNEVPILFALGWISIRLRNGGWKAVGLVRPNSWWKTIVWAVMVGVLVIVAGQFATMWGERVWHTAAKGSSVLQTTKATWQAALGSLGLVWTFAAFGEEMSYRGYLLTRAADVGDRSTLSYLMALLASSVLFGYGHYYKGPAGILQSTVSGLILGGAYLLSRRNLWIPILAHGCADTIVIIAFFFGWAD